MKMSRRDWTRTIPQGLFWIGIAKSPGSRPIELPGKRTVKQMRDESVIQAMRFRARRQGQALVVAVTILFILLALALLFLRNALFHVQSTGISNERIADVTLAHSGVDFV